MELPSLRRPHYFAGRLLSAEDLQAEQAYQQGKRRLLNRFLHGAGIVRGLEAELQGDTVHVQPGLALDCAGREIVVPEPTTLPLPAGDTGTVLQVAHEEREEEPTPVAGAADPPIAARWIVEGWRWSFVAADPFAGHRVRKRRFEACGGDHPVGVAWIGRRRGARRIERITTGGRLGCWIFVPRRP